jgi:hypothetical protein
MANLRPLFLLIASIAVPLAISSCKTNPPSASAIQRAGFSAESANANTVSFKIQELDRHEVKEGEEVNWLATHESSAGEARFRITMVLRTPRGESPFAISTGAFIRETESQYSEFLRQIAKALEAKKPSNSKIGMGRSGTGRLDFIVALLGRNLSRGRGSDVVGGGFTSEPQGDWIATKIFVADGGGEFLLNLNSRERRGEISMKDPSYGNVVLRELSRVF